MATQEQLDEENQASLKRQRQSRSDRRARRDLKDARSEAPKKAIITEQRRGIKEAYEGAVYNLDTSYMPRLNKTDYESDIGQRGIDQFTAPETTPEQAGGSANTFTLDVVKDDNTAGTATFNGSGVN